LRQDVISGDTGIVGDNGGPGLPGSTKILGKEGGCMGTASNQIAEIRKNQN